MRRIPVLTTTALTLLIAASAFAATMMTHKMGDGQMMHHKMHGKMMHGKMMHHKMHGKMMHDKMGMQKMDMKSDKMEKKM